MRAYLRLVAVLLGATLATTGCTQTASVSKSDSTSNEKVTVIKPGAEAQKQAQTALIKAKPGEVIEFAEGRFDFDSTLSLEDTNNITIRGKGPDKTILSFAKQQQGTGGEGIRLGAKENITVKDLAVEDAKGDAVKVQNTKHVVFKNVKVTWTGGPKTTNGAYGVYPVLCTDVLIEDCEVQGASDAGIYVGQSENIIVRRCRAEKNVAGIEIENSINADVYENTATDNAGGILVFTLPDLPKKEGRNCRVFDNKVFSNNHENFAAKGTAVSTVPPGTGVMLMANYDVELFGNTIEKNDSTGLLIVSYLINRLPLKDSQYDPFCEGIAVHDNKFSGNGTNPAGDLAAILGNIVGKPFPDIMYDGWQDEKKFVDGALPKTKGLSVRNNGDAGFVSFDGKGLNPANVLANKKPNLIRDPAQFEGELQALQPVSIAGVK